METKPCSLCKKVLDISNFCIKRQTSSGLNPQCKSCASIQKGIAYKRDKTKLLAKERAIRVNDTSRYLFRKAKERALIDDLPFTITVEDIIVPEYCPILNIKLVVNEKYPKKDSPNLDKIIPELGYVVGNIQVISRLANTMKQNATPEELLLFAEWINKTFNTTVK